MSKISKKVFSFIGLFLFLLIRDVGAMTYRQSINPMSLKGVKLYLNEDFCPNNDPLRPVLVCCNTGLCPLGSCSSEGMARRQFLVDQIKNDFVLNPESFLIFDPCDNSVKLEYIAFACGGLLQDSNILNALIEQIKQIYPGKQIKLKFVLIDSSNLYRSYKFKSQGLLRDFTPIIAKRINGDFIEQFFGWFSSFQDIKTDLFVYASARDYIHDCKILPDHKGNLLVCADFRLERSLIQEGLKDGAYIYELGKYREDDIDSFGCKHYTPVEGCLIDMVALITARVCYKEKNIILDGLRVFDFQSNQWCHSSVYAFEHLDLIGDRYE